MLFLIPELTDFLQHLDTRANAAIKELKKFAADRKARVIGNALESLPPAGTPSWTINKDWMKGIIFFLNLSQVTVISHLQNPTDRYCAPD